MTIDVSTFDGGSEARKALAAQLHEAMTTKGFFVLTGHNVMEEEIKRQVDIGYVRGIACSLTRSCPTVIEATTLEEKKQLEGHMDTTGRYRGFKLRQYYE